MSDNIQGEYQGKDAHGYSYYRCVDHRIWQYAPDGRMVGWLCSVGAWERTMKKLIAVKP